jgi:glycerol uptake facilitator-like aquaporin
MKITLGSYVAEFVGTFFFLLSILASAGSPLVIGAVLALVVFLIAGLSGGHVNPAVSFMTYLNGGMRPSEMLGYVVSQLAGGAAALYAFKAARL